MNIVLLTHERELAKGTNTGNLVLDSLGEQATRIVWQRKDPASALLTLIDTAPVALLYPTDSPSAPMTAFSHCVILDGTWQEARKMLNRSDYLQALPTVAISPSTASRFSLRRNQVPGGLCTAECVIEVLRATGDTQTAAALEADFLAFVSG